MYPKLKIGGGNILPSAKPQLRSWVIFPVVGYFYINFSIAYPCC